MSALIDWLNSTAFILFGDEPTSWAELLGFATGAVCVYLVAIQNIWNWPIGIANNVLWILLFATAGLYADSGLQVVYIALALAGWYRWLTGAGARAALPVSRTGAQEAAVLAAAGVAGTAAMYLFLDHLTPSTVPFWDAVTTVLSLLATWGQIMKRLESWWLWMAADVIYVPLYAHKGLHLTAILYVGFFLLCLRGYLNWRRSYRAASGVVRRTGEPAHV